MLQHSGIQFGTAGLRGKMQVGFSSMNCLTVIQASQGLAKFVQSRDAQRAVEHGVVIGADARHNSHRFAVLVANAMRALGFKVHWLGSVVQTPLVAWATGFTGAAAGVMITASHVRNILCYFISDLIVSLINFNIRIQLKTTVTKC
jgi:phosphoglucomutase